MTYNKNIWQNGDIITAEKLNNIEDYIKYIEASKNLNILITNIQKNFEDYFNSLIN